MPRLMFSFILFACGLTAGPAAAAAQDQPTVVFVVRHAEKGPGNPDPSLNDKGKERARALAQLLADAKISAILVSQFKRTQETAEPLAGQLRVTPQVLDAGKLDLIPTAIGELPPGSRALVVSHSNLVPAIIEKLSGEKVGELTDADYDRIYVVTLRQVGTGSVLYLHYGAPSAAGSGPMR